MSGPPPTPNERRRRTGNPQKRPLATLEETGTIRGAVNGKIPETLRPLDPAGTQMWDRVLTAGTSWIAGSDLELLQMVCEQVDERELIRARLRDPEMLDHWRGSVSVRALEDQIAKGLSSLGLSPEARTRLGLAQVTIERVLEDTNARRGRYRPMGTVVEAEVVEEKPMVKPRKSWTRAKVVLWFQENGVEYRESWTKKDLLKYVGVKP